MDMIPADHTILADTFPRSDPGLYALETEVYITGRSRRWDRSSKLEHDDVFRQNENSYISAVNLTSSSSIGIYKRFFLLQRNIHLTFLKQKTPGNVRRNSRMTVLLYVYKNRR